MSSVVSRSDWRLFLMALVSAVIGYVVNLFVYPESDSFIAILIAAVILVIMKYILDEVEAISEK
jgi:divalent metal cation (Fe/Co/Zn/Cd) transporter